MRISLTKAVAILALALACSAAYASGTIKLIKHGPPAPAFALKDLQGNTHSMDAYRGKVLIVNFWATWCPPCRAEMPALERVWRSLESEGVALIAIDFGEPEADVTQFAVESKTSIPLLLDTHGTQAHLWGVRSLPTTFIIGRDGRVAYRVQGERKWDSPHIVQQIRALAKHP
jgi:peroxiredoxin